MRQARLRQLGRACGTLPCGSLNAITDVQGVRVGHSTLVRGSGRGAVRTGVTAIVPNPTLSFQERVAAGGFVLNGAGELTGLHQVKEWGLIETPILLTNTMSVGNCYRGCVEYMLSRYPSIGSREDVVIPIVGECDDSFLNDASTLSVGTEQVFEAIESAREGAVLEGSVGAGTGMMTCDFKAGIGTASRQVGQGYHVGVLVLSNFGRWEDLRGVNPAALARALEGVTLRRTVPGSIVVVVATDAPLIPHQLGRLSRRASLGIARVGSYAAHGSGELMLAFSTTTTTPRRPRARLRKLSCVWDHDLDPLFQACVEATEEAILNSLCAADTMEGADGHLAMALPLDLLRPAGAR